MLVSIGFPALWFKYGQNLIHIYSTFLLFSIKQNETFSMSQSQMTS